MKRNFYIGMLIVCFGSSSVNISWAVEAMNVPAVIAQPDLQELNQSMLNRDRQNRNEEIEIRKLIEENNELTQTTLANEENAGLAKVNQTMLAYRDALLSRDRERIASNGVQWSSRYGDLIALTEDADAMTDERGILEGKSDLIAQKYVMLTQLKDEIAALNEKLESQQTDNAGSKDAIIESYKKIAEDQQGKIQMLTQQLGQMDQRIAGYDAILAEKDHQISQLKDDLMKIQGDAATQDGMIKEQQNQIAVLETRVKELSLSSTGSVALPAIILNTSVDQQQPAAAPVVVSSPAAVIKEDSSQSGPLAQLQEEIRSKDEIIKEQKNQIDALLRNFNNPSSSSETSLALPPVIVNQHPPAAALVNPVAAPAINPPIVIKEDLSQPRRLAKLQEKVYSQDEIIKQQKEQIDALLRNFKDSPSSAGTNVALPPIIVNASNPQPVNQVPSMVVKTVTKDVVPASILAQIEMLKAKVLEQSSDLKRKNESINWLNQVLNVTKDKAEYYKLSSQQNQLSMKQVQEQVQGIKDDFAQRSKDYDQFENAIASLKSQVSQLSLQLSQKQSQVDLLKSQLADKAAEEKDQSQQEALVEKNLKDQLQDKENQIIKMRSDIQDILQNQEQKANYLRSAYVRLENLKLAKQLIDLQEQEASLLNEKSDLITDQNTLFEQHTQAIEDKIKQLMANHQIQMENLENHLQELQGQLDQKEDEAVRLKTELDNKISQEKNQSVLESQIDDLKYQLEDKEGQINGMKIQIQSGRESKEEVDSLRQQLLAQQDASGQLKQQLANKLAESSQMTSMMGDYQKKLDAKNNAYNEQLGQTLSAKNYQAQMQKQIDDLSTRLQGKEAEVVTIKKKMYDLQALTSERERNMQAKDLDLSMVQQKMNEKLNEYQQKADGLQAVNAKQMQELTNLKVQLALARQQIDGMPSSDEIEFLRTGLKKATAELKQKDDMFSQVKANADEYEKEYKDQTREFKSLKDQLQSAYDDIHNRNEDLKYKNLEVIRLKERAAMSQGDLQQQVGTLTQQLDVANKKLMGKGQGNMNMVGALQLQLKNADLQIKDLKDELNQLNSSFKNDSYGRKLKQALDKIDEQGQVLNILVDKLRAAGEKVDLVQLVSSLGSDHFNDGVAK